MKRRSSVTVLAGLWLALYCNAAVAGSCLKDADAFRSQLDLMLSDLRETSALMSSWAASEAALLSRSVAELEDALAVAADEDLTVLCELFERRPEVATAPRQLNAVLARAASAAEGGCNVLPSDTAEALRHTVVGLKAAAALLKAVCDSTKCLSLACIIPCTLHGIADSLIFIPSEILSISSFCKTDNQQVLVADFADATAVELGEIDGGLAAVAARIDVKVSSRASEGQLVEVREAAAAGFLELGERAGALAGAMADHAVDRAAFEERSLLQRIESHLQPGETGRISTLQLPASVGGLLETVREIVADTILANGAAGTDVERALQLFGEGDQLFNEQQYKPAFDRYREAYRRAIAGSSL